MKPVILAATLALAGCSPLVGALLDDNPDGATDAQPDTGTVYCEASSPCPDGYFCLYDDCEATIGRCKQVPADCSDADALPVCGCDGVTYSNECELHRARQSLQFVGECVSETCTSDNRTSCPGGYFCNGNCGVFEGWCEPIPDGCVAEPVCGCDPSGDPITYASMCDMASSLGWFAYIGECGAGSCRENDSEGVCGPSDFCEGLEGQCGSGLAGRCTPRLPGCDAAYEPVCGCDGTTYGNDCLRQQAGVWLAHPGPCMDTTTCAVGPYGTPCPAGTFCEVVPGVCPEQTDLSTPGYCVAFEDCTSSPCGPAAPVCGCDGVEYGGDCERRMAGVNLACCSTCAECLEIP